MGVIKQKNRKPGKHKHIADEYNARYEEQTHRRATTCIICGTEMRTNHDGDWYLPKYKKKY